MAASLAALDPIRLIAIAWWLALVGMAVLQQAHDGRHEHLELAPLLHLVRDGALAVPAAALAIVLASLVVLPRVRARLRPVRNGTSDADRLLWVLAAAAVFAVLSVPGHQLHEALFGAESESLGFLEHSALDGSIAFVGSVIALFPIAIVAGLPLRQPTSQPNTVAARSTT